MLGDLATKDKAGQQHETKSPETSRTQAKTEGNEDREVREERKRETRGELRPNRRRKYRAA